MPGVDFSVALNGLNRTVSTPLSVFGPVDWRAFRRFDTADVSIHSSLFLDRTSLSKEKVTEQIVFAIRLACP
jgi:hypothetical protein